LGLSPSLGKLAIAKHDDCALLQKCADQRQASGRRRADGDKIVYGRRNSVVGIRPRRGDRALPKSVESDNLDLGNAVIRRTSGRQEMWMAIKSFAIAIVAVLTLCCGARAQGYSTPAEQRYSPYSANLPACDDPGVLAMISSRFAQKESEYWKSPLQIAGYDRVREIGFRANGPGYIPRRYCLARAQLSDLKPRPVVYAIGEGEEILGFGFLGVGYGVEWCVVGLDRNLAYAPGCQAVRPITDVDIVGEKGMQKIMQDLSRTVKANQ
jgi:hypothetical protein